MYEKNNKENVLGNTGPLKVPASNKNRTNIGEEIRKKLKINTPLANTNSLSILMPRDLNVEGQKSRIKQSFQIRNKGDRENMMQRSVDLGRETSRSVKSVRFEEKADEKKLNRKHSTSSILKNNKQTKKQRFSDKLSMNNSMCSNIMKQDQSTQNSVANKTLKQKYERTFETLKKTQKKYFDEMFPQILTSISRSQDKTYKQLKWMRLSELYSGKYLTVWDSNQQLRILPGKYSSSQSLHLCLNSLKHNNFLLQKIFECQSFNQHGIYYLKVNQNNTWKYILIDDYIPVYYVDKKPYPAFLSIVTQNNNHVQLWPFLLQKAYAKYYSNYQCLGFGGVVEFLQEITGCYPCQLQTSEGKGMDEIVQEVGNYDSVLIAKDNQGKYYPIVPRRPMLTVQTPESGYLPTSYTTQQFKTSYTKVYCVLLHKYFYSGMCTIKTTRQLSSSAFSSQSQNKNNISIRSIKIEEPSQCVFSLMQKDIKHYYLGDYRYVWVRLIVVMKESQNSYRWVEGAYTNTKYLNLSLWLQPAQYQILIIPQWENNKPYDLTLTFHGNIKSNIERVPYIGNEHIIIEAAMDLAQSKGKLKQLNQNICTYSYIEQKVGFIIENINNERPNGYVRILRSIEGLQKNGENLIRAYNKEFQNCNTIEVKIESLRHFTVLLAVQAGVNRAFLDQFDFGS